MIYNALQNILLDLMCLNENKETMTEIMKNCHRESMDMSNIKSRTSLQNPQDIHTGCKIFHSSKKHCTIPFEYYKHG